MGEGGTAVILQRTEPGICVDLIASGRQITTAIITAQIVAERSHRGRPVGVILVINVPTGRTSIENRASNRQSRIADGAGVIDAAAVVDGRVAAKSAVDDRERVRVPDAAAFARVAAAVELPLNVLLVIVTVPVLSLRMPPPWSAELPLKVLLVTARVAALVVVPLLRIPPAAYSAELPLTVLLLNVRVPSSFMMPPPKEAELPLILLFVIVTVASPAPNQLLQMAPPYTDELPLKVLPLTMSVP